MKKIFSLITISAITALSLFAQTKKDGTPDMRYKANKQTNVNTYYVPRTNTSVRYQSGYLKENGTVVQPHYKTTTNKTNLDNFSTNGNTNAYSGKSGFRAKDYSPASNNYGKGKTIQLGSKGGQYYINNKSNKTYVPKRLMLVKKIK